MTILRMLACGSVLLFAVGCSSSTAGNTGGGSDSGGGSDGTTDGMQSGSEGGTDAAGDSSNGGSDAPSDTGSGGDSTSATDSPYDAGPPGDATSCTLGFSLCNGYCVDEQDDIHNCGGCGTVCQGANPYCDHGTCGTPPCDGGACTSATFCCGSDCCSAGQLCCDVPSNIPSFPKCTDPVNGTCPLGCLGCP